MTLRVQITAVYGAILVATMAIAASLGQSIARRAIEQAQRDRAVEVAHSILSDLDLPNDLSRLGRDEIGDRLTAAVPLHRGVRRAELVIAQGLRHDLVRADVESGGIEVTFPEPPPAPATRASSMVLDAGDDVRLAEVVLPVSPPDPKRPPRASLRVEVDVSDATQIARRERHVFLWVTVASTLVLVVAFTALLGRMLARPLRELSDAMERVRSGAAEGVEVPGTVRSDEIGALARGLDAMLTRVRGFNQELQDRIAAATADLAAKNRALADLNAQLVSARHDLESKERLAALGQLTGTIAHELGNPLNAISGHVQLVARAPDCPPSMREGLAIVEREAKRMTTILRRFLDSARALSPEAEPVDLADLVDEVLSVQVSASARDRIRVSREVAPGLGRVALDAGLVRHVVGNLVSNAIDAMPGGGSLHVRVRADNGRLAISVQDSGHGIGPEERKRIFEPFYSTKPPGHGSGLGLAISREIAGALKGHLEVESAPGAGATFTLYLPMPHAPAKGEAGWTRRSSG